jgi:hypothetical protein
MSFGTKGLEISTVIENRDVLDHTQFSGFRHCCVHHSVREFRRDAVFLNQIKRRPRLGQSGELADVGSGLAVLARLRDNKAVENGEGFPRTIEDVREADFRLANRQPLLRLL